MIEDMKAPNDSRAGQAVSTTLTPPPSQQKSRNTSYDVVDMLDHERQMKEFLDVDPLLYHGNDRMNQKTEGVLNSVEEANDQTFGMNGFPDIHDIVNGDGSDSSTIVPIHQRRSHYLYSFILLLILVIARSLATAPLEIQNMIFELLLDENDLCTSVCLGLTCKQLRLIFLSFNSDRIPLTVSTEVEGEYEGETIWLSLATLLHDWVPPEYRLSRGPISYRHGPMFLNMEIYGDMYAACGGEARSQKEIELVRKWQDFERNSELPSPFRKGDDWYPEVARALQKKWNRENIWVKEDGKTRISHEMRNTRKWFGNSTVRKWFRGLGYSKIGIDSCKKDWMILMDFNEMRENISLY